MLAIRRWLAGSLLALAPVLGGAVAADRDPWPLVDEQAVIARVLSLADQRLALMPDVAAAKWPTQQPISDPPREAAVIAAAGRRAEAVGLAREPVEQLFALQIRLAKQVQEHLFAQWQAGREHPPETVRSLGADLRPQLDRLTTSVLDALYLLAPMTSHDDFAPTAQSLASAALPGDRWPDEARAELVASLGRIRYESAPSIGRAKAAGVLRIGTPADYAPFSVATSGLVSGSDIELAARLATHLGLRPVFLKTRWADLAADLLADRFDIAVGGVSVTAARTAIADFSPAFARAGKTAVGRCTDAQRLNSLAAIDRPAIRLVENAGGTNETIGRRLAPRAALRIHPDNTTVLDEILAGRADVMFTDETEVALAVHRHPALCRLLQQAFEPADKAFLLRRDAGWKDAIDPWAGDELAHHAPADLLEFYTIH